MIIPLPSVQKLTPSFPNKRRDIWAAYVEDLWDIMDDLRLTMGGRYDHYSDVGGQFSPRVGINWEFLQHYYAKFMYERSFRAPSLQELYHPFDGNPDLKPMTKDSYELSFGFRFFPFFNAQLTGFYYRPKDLISYELVAGSIRRKYYNVDTKIKNKGVELQMKYDFGRGTYLSLNYTYIDLDVWDADGQRVTIGGQPFHFGTLGANVRLNRYLNLNTYLLYRGGVERWTGDTREDPSDYAIVNATLIARNFLKELKGLEVRGSVLNLFNKDYTSPSGPDYLPDDLPMPGINFFLEFRYTF